MVYQNQPYTINPSEPLREVFENSPEYRFIEQLKKIKESGNICGADSILKTMTDTKHLDKHRLCDLMEREKGVQIFVDEGMGKYCSMGAQRAYTQLFEFYKTLTKQTQKRMQANLNEMRGKAHFTE